MTAKEIQNLREGDVIFDIEKSVGYHISKVHEGYVEYTDGVGAGSIPTKHLLRWNYISLMREREENWSEEDQAHFRTILAALEQTERLAKAGLFVSEELDPNIAVLARVEAARDWLKLRKPHRSYWRPSKEQMRALHEAEIRARGHVYGYALSTLEMDLESKL